MQKLVLGVTALAVLGCLWWALTVAVGVAPAAPQSAAASPGEPSSSLTATTEAAPAADARGRSPASVDRQPVATPEERAPASGEARIHGVARWEDDGKPADAVTVWCQPTTGLSVVPPGTVTDADGRFAFAGLRATTYVLRADRGGQAAVALEPDADAEVTLTIPRGIAVAGVVRDGEQRPVAGARIWLSDRFVLDHGALVTVTDADGRFALRSVGKERYLGARAVGYRSSAVRYLQAEPGESVVLELVLVRDDARVGGRVFDATGQPFAAAVVRAAPSGRPDYVPTADGSIVRAWAPAIARTDDDGTFELAGLPPGPLEVLARGEGHGTFRAELDVPPGGRGTVFATLPAAGTVAGRVSREDGEPLARAMVRSGKGWDDFAKSTAMTDGDGAFVLHDLTPGATDVAVIVDGAIAITDQVPVAAGQTTRWDPVLRELAIRGRVVDAAQRTLEGVHVALRRGEEWAGATTTDGDGRFAFGGLRSEAYQLRVAFEPSGAHRLYHSDVAVVTLDDVVPSSQEVLVEVPEGAMPTCRVHGRVLAAGGVAEQVVVEIHRIDGSGGVSSKTDAATGAFAIDRLVPGAYWITVRAERHPAIQVGRRELKPEDDVDLGVLTLTEGNVIAGRLVGMASALSAAELDAIEVSIVDAKGQQSGVVDHQGATFRSSELAPGDYVVQVHGPGVAADVKRCRVGAGQETHVDVPLQRGAYRVVEARLPAGAEAPRWVWGTLMRDGTVLGGAPLQPQSDGRYLWELWLAPGRYDVFVGAHRIASGHGQVTVDPAMQPAPPLAVTMSKL